MGSCDVTTRSIPRFHGWGVMLPSSVIGAAFLLWSTNVWDNDRSPRQRNNIGITHDAQSNLGRPANGNLVEHRSDIDRGAYRGQVSAGSVSLETARRSRVWGHDRFGRCFAERGAILLDGEVLLLNARVSAWWVR